MPPFFHSMRNIKHMFHSTFLYSTVIILNCKILKNHVSIRNVYPIHTIISKLHCQRAQSFHQPKLAQPVMDIYWMKIVNKISFEHGAPPGVNEYRTPPWWHSFFYWNLLLQSVNSFRKTTTRFFPLCFKMYCLDSQLFPFQILGTAQSHLKVAIFLNFLTRFDQNWGKTDEKI